MKADFLFASLNQKRTIQKNRCQNKEHFMDDVILETRGIIYLNVESWFLFAPSYQNFWLRACWGPPDPGRWGPQYTIHIAFNT